MGSRYLGLGSGGQWFLHHPVPAPTHPSPPLLTGSGPTSKLQALPHLASGRRNASSVVEGLQKNRCSVSRPFHSPRGGRRLSSPQEAGAGPELASGCQQGRGGALGRGRRALKASFGRLSSSKLTTCLPLDTMWFPALCLALSLAGTGETVGKMGEGGDGP